MQYFLLDIICNAPNIFADLHMLTIDLLLGFRVSLDHFSVCLHICTAAPP